LDLEQLPAGEIMSAELSLLFLEKRVEAARLCAAITEPFATGGEPIEASKLAADYLQVADNLEDTLKELTSLNDGLEADKNLEAGDIRHVRGRISTAVGEVARAAQDFAAQIRFFEAMNPDGAATVKPALDKFDSIEKSTRDFTVPEAPEEGAELAPADEAGLNDDDVDPMLM
jgi:hypothetical protein